MLAHELATGGLNRPVLARVILKTPDGFPLPCKGRTQGFHIIALKRQQKLTTCHSGLIYHRNCNWRSLNDEGLPLTNDELSEISLKCLVHEPIYSLSEAPEF